MSLNKLFSSIFVFGIMMARLLAVALVVAQGIRLEGEDSTPSNSLVEVEGVVHPEAFLGAHVVEPTKKPPANFTKNNSTKPKNDSLKSVENLLVGAMGNKSASGLVGVSQNSDHDFETMRTAASFNFLSSLVAFIAFVLCRHFCPAVYCKPELMTIETADTRSLLNLPRRLFDWASSVHTMEDEDVLKHAGLDGLMFLEFMSLGRQLAVVWSVVIVGVLGPLHYFLHRSTSTDPAQLLSMTSYNGLILAHLPRSQQLILTWGHVVAVWYLVVSSCSLIYFAQLRFLVHRFNWLKHIPPPRATTLLVENLPKECRSDDALRVYFARLFGPQTIVQAYVVRRTERLRKLFTDVESTASRLHLEEVRQPGRECPCGSEVDKGLLRSTLVDLKAEVSKEQKKVEEAVQQMDLKVCSSAGFVTFTSRRMCMLALSPQYRADASQLTTTMPPDPEDVIYQDLAKDPEVRAGGVVTAGALLLLIFIIWAPMIATFLDKVEPFIVSVQNPQARHLLQGVMRTGVLKMFMSCLPTLFMAIIHNFLTLKAGAWAQLKLQDWFFAFQLVFILLVTTIVGTVLNVLEKLLAHPGEVVYILADALPGFSNFYINYILLSCFLQVFDLLRTMNLAKYLFWRGRNADPDEARHLSEPEDQDSDGMGSRMAKVAIHLVVCTVFASCCPVILLVAWLYFALGRYTYGFLVIFAETKKPDMGGAFWVKSLRHLFLGVLIYILLMVGLLSRTSPDREPMLCAFAFILALGFGYLRFSSLSWEALPFEALPGLHGFCRILL
eukprot:s1121_g1.t1